MNKAHKEMPKDRRFMDMAAVSALWVLVIILLLMTSPLQAKRHLEEGKYIDLRLKILMRALTYEKGLQKKKDVPLRTGVLFDPQSPKSTLESSAVIRTLEAQAGQLTFMGRQIVVIGVPLAKGPGLAANLGIHLCVLYVAAGIKDKDIFRVLKQTRKQKIITFTGTEQYIDLGVTLAVIVQKTSPRIIINESAARAENAVFSSRLLQLVEIRGREAGHEP